MKILLKLNFFIIFFFLTVNCYAVQTSPDLLQIKYQKNSEIEPQNNRDARSEFHSVYQIPEVTYRYLENVFASFYNTLSFNTSITDSTLNETLDSQLISVPLIATNKQGLQMEVFGNFSDLSTQYLSNLSSDHALHDYIANSEQFDIYDSNLSLGAGISFSTGQSSKIKLIISNEKIPGYGNSNALFGFETRF
ncbi:MAG: hypothetical protein OQK77_12620 [Psychromonas sp.]|nr:hypothetical protein [Psychromonas sp.]